MTNAIRFTVLTLAALSASLPPAPARAKGPAFADPNKAAKADKDFDVQGEYLGKITADGEDIPIGIQVIAHGEGKFRAVAYPGGLPGAGWNGKEKIITDGKRDGETIEFENEHGIGVLRNGIFVIEAKDGSARGELTKHHRKSPTLGKKPPKGAVVLFNGKNVDAWKNGKLTADKLLEQGVESKQLFGSHSIHIEFRLPYQPQDRGQARGNSGIYVQGRYEVQMLDSFGLEGKNNESGGIYEIRDPDVNMCLPPLVWQTYDIDFTAAKFDSEGKMSSKPKITVRHNGVVVQKDVELPKSTRASKLKPGPENGPIYLQNHGNPVRYRNIWVVEK